MNHVSHFESCGDSFEAVEMNIWFLEGFCQLQMKHLFVKHWVLMKVFFIQLKFAADTINNGMDSFVSSCSPTVLEPSLEFGVIISGKEPCFMKKRDDFVLDWEDVLLFLVLHTIVALSIVTEKERHPVARHWLLLGEKEIKL